MKDNSNSNIQPKISNKQIIIKLIRDEGLISRTSLHEKSNISKAGITRLIDELIQDGYVLEANSHDTNRGRKPIFLKINPSAFYCIGVNISRFNIHCVLINGEIDIICSKTRAINSFDNTLFLQLIHDIIQEVIIETKDLVGDNINGIGVGIAGLVDHQLGQVIDFYSMHRLSNIPIKQFLIDSFGLPVLIDNNANARAFGEYWYNNLDGFKNLILVICQQGVGSGIISNGEILRGKYNITGEFGHTSVNIFGKQCKCGRFGCVESYCSIDAIEECAKSAYRFGKKSLLFENIKSVDEINFSLICTFATMGDDLAKSILEDTAIYLASGIATLLTIINTETLILSGDIFEEYSPFFELVVAQIKTRVFHPLLADIKFVKRKTNDKLYAAGAATLIYSYVLDRI